MNRVRNRVLLKSVLGLMLAGGCQPTTAPTPVGPDAPARVRRPAIASSAPAQPVETRFQEPDFWTDPALPAQADIAQLHLRAGRPGMARIAFEAAWQADPRPEFALWAGILWQRAEQHATAIRWLDRVVYPALATVVHDRVVRSASALGDAAQALWAAEQIPKASRFHDRAVRRVAKLLLRTGQPAEALAWLAHHEAEDFSLSAKAHARLRQWPEAIRYWQRVLLQSPPKSMAQTARRAIARLTRRVRARDRAALRAPPPDAALIAGRADLAAHRYAALEARMLLALRAGDDRCEIWWLLARARGRQRQHAAAAPAYARAAEICQHPRAPRARFAEARAWFNIGHRQAALDALTMLAHDWPDHRLADDGLLLSARIHLAEGAPLRAQDRLKRLLWRYPAGDVATDAAWLLYQQTGTISTPLPQANDRSQIGRLAYFRDRAMSTAESFKAAVLNGRPSGRRRSSLRSSLCRHWRASDWSICAPRRSPSDRFAQVFKQSPSGYYAAWAAAHGVEPPEIAVASPRIPMTHPARIEGQLLLELGLVQDAWWAFDAAGPHPLEPGRYTADIARLFAQYGHLDLAARMFERDVPHLDGLPMTPDTAPWFERVYPLPHLDRFTHWAAVHRVPVALLLAIAHTESRFDPSARSWAGACGLMQLIPATARAVARREGIRGHITCRRLRRVDLSIQLAARYLADLRDRFGDHPVVLAAAYNAGPGNVARWLKAPRPAPDLWVEQIPFHQARRYVKRVIAALPIYAQRANTPLPLLRLDW